MSTTLPPYTFNFCLDLDTNLASPSAVIWVFVASILVRPVQAWRRARPVSERARQLLRSSPAKLSPPSPPSCANPASVNFQQLERARYCNCETRKCDE